MSKLSVVFQLKDSYQLTRATTITVRYWYAAEEGKEARYLGVVEEIPGNNSVPLTYEQARAKANRQ